MDFFPLKFIIIKPTVDNIPAQAFLTRKIFERLVVLRESILFTMQFINRDSSAYSFWDGFTPICL